MTSRGQDIVSVIKQQIEQFGAATTTVDVGTVVEVGDGIVRIYGLASVKYNELLQFPGEIMGIALNLEEDSVGIVILGEDIKIKEGETVKRTQRIVEVPVGKELLGRVVNPLGEPLDGRGPINAAQYNMLERKAPGVIYRQSVNEPLQTGLKAVDGMTPVGGTVGFEDPDKDVVLYRVSKQDCGEGAWIRQEALLDEFQGMSTGRFLFFMNVSSDCPHGEYFIEVSVFDRQGHESNALRVPYRICEFFPCDV